MKKHLTLATVLVLMIVLISPFSVSAKTKAGVKSGSFFYFFDKVFEKADLFFTFNPEKKAKKALDNAEERLAEAEESASENNQEAVETAMKDYQENISLAEMEAKAIEDETKTKDLLSTIASSTSKYQEILTEVLNKVPEQAKEAIQKAIEASKKGVEKADEKNTELKKEVSEIKPEVEETKNELKEKENEEKAEIKDDKKEENKKEIEKLKKEIETLKQKTSQIKVIEKIIEKEKPITIEKKENSSSQTKQNENIVTLPNGAVVEMNENGNVVRTIKEAPQSTYVMPVPTMQNQTKQTSDTNTTAQTSSHGLKINLSMGSNSAKAIPSASNQIIAKFTIYSQDGKINSSKSVFKLSISNGTGKIEDLSNFLLVDKNGTIVAGPVNPNNESVLIFTDTVTFPKGTMEYTLKGNIGVNFSNEQWIYASANIDNWIFNISEESKPHIQSFQASEMGVFVSSQTNQVDNNGNFIVNINLTSLTDLTALTVKLVNKETSVEYQQNPLRNLNNYSVVFTNIPHGNYDLKIIADATTLIGVVQTFTSAVLVQ